MQPLYESHNTERKIPYIYHSCGTGFLLHWHENVEILHFTYNGTVVCDGKEYHIPAGGFAVIGSDVLHSIAMQSTSFYSCFIADSTFCCENGIDVTKLDFTCSVSDEKLSVLYGRLTNEIENPSKFSDAAVKAAMLNLMLYLCRNYSTERKLRQVKNESIKKAVTFINSHLTKKLTVEEIASHAALSKYYFCREFKKATGVSVIRYINAKRCHTAEKLLATKKYTVSEAASSVGYDNLSYFTRTFKSITGHLPGEYKG